MKILKKGLKITGITILILLILAFVIPIVFKKQITRLVKNEINKTLSAKVDFSDVKLSLLKHFPRVTIVIKDLSIIGDTEFSGDTLIYAKTVDASANLFSVIKGKDIKIYGVWLQSPRIHALVDSTGKMNWDITKTTSSGTFSDTSVSAFKISLKSYEIKDGYIEYRDERAQTFTEWKQVNHKGSGDITLDEFTLSTTTHSESTDFMQDGIPYLRDTHAEIKTDIKINNKTQTYTFQTEKLVLNNLELTAKGFFQLINDSTFNIDIAFNSPNNEFKNLLSMIPGIYKKDFGKLQTSGEAAFSGFVKGVLGEGSFPAYDVNVKIKNGYFKYPDLPGPVKNINLDLHASNPDGLPDNAVINIPNGHIEMANEPFDFRLILKNPVTSKYIDAAAKGKIDLSQVSKFIKLDANTKMSGLVHADAFGRGNMKSLQTASGKFDAGGFFIVKNLYYAAKELSDPIRNGNIEARIYNKNGDPENTMANISSGHIEMGKDIFDFSGKLTKPAAILDFNGVYRGTEIKGSGNLKNLFGFIMRSESLSGTLTASLDKMNLNDWIGKPQISVQTITNVKPFIVPTNINVSVDASASRVTYDKVDFDQIKGDLVISDETIQLKNFKAQALEGTLVINGTYSTKNSKTKPDIAVSYDVQTMDIQKAFYAFNTIKFIMPIGKFLDGKLNSSLSMTGSLKNDMMPDMQSLSGKGNLLLLQGVLKKFAPLEKIATVLQIDRLKSISVKDIKNYFEFANGKVTVKPFNLKVEDIEMLIGGKHGFDQSLEYLVAMKVPRSYMGSSGNNFIEGLVLDANKKGIPLKLGDKVDLNIKVGGTLSNPSIKIDLAQIAGNIKDELKKQAEDFVKSKIDTVKQKVKDTVAVITNKLKDSLKQKLKDRFLGKDTTKAPPPDSPKKKTDAVKDVIKDIFNRKKKKDSL